ncbi:hypothetical protein [Bradyrhizobium sp. BR 10261]|uniref:hypothetical protein n=1 Tax=Bradyrhizobium sp. BR 10261 TaxID=2749992 RepID=UPI00289B277A|nr:hypothetical protein [Bradyrhizobium sp. BR 10261]
MTIVLRETRPMKLKRKLVVMLTLTLMGATSMTDPSVAQAQSAPQAFSPTITGVMVILTAKAGVTREQVMAVMPAEIQETVQLYLGGKIRDFYSRGDGRGVVFFIDVRDVAAAKAIMEDLPLAKQDLMDHEYIAIGPLLPLRLLMASPERRQ